MNILFVNNFYNLFAKADCGASQRSMCIIQALSKIGQVDVISFVDDTISTVDNVDVIYSKYVDMAPQKGGRFDKFLKLFSYHKPYSIYPENKIKSNVIKQFVTQKHYDYIVTRYVHFACDCGLLKYADKLIVDIDDDPKEVVLMTLDKVKTLRNKIFTRLYAYTIDKVTRHIISTIHSAFYSTPSQHYKNAYFLPNISAYQKPLQSIDFTQEIRNILIVGRYAYLPNAEGLKHFVQNVFPLIKKEVPNAILNVVGRISDDELYKLCSIEDVKLLGFVENLEDVYAKSHCVVVPLYRGTGTSVKLVESMSLGRAVVSTPCGCRGLHTDFLPNKAYFLAYNDEQFAEYVVTLLTTPSANEEIRNNALVQINKHYSTNIFESTIATVLSIS